MQEAKEYLDTALPSVCDYFNNRDFYKIRQELDTYEGLVKEHYDEFQMSLVSWSDLIKKTIL